jgi:hypothetical protein
VFVGLRLDRLDRGIDVEPGGRPLEPYIHTGGVVSINRALEALFKAFKALIEPYTHRRCSKYQHNTHLQDSSLTGTAGECVCARVFVGVFIVRLCNVLQTMLTLAHSLHE